MAEQFPMNLLDHFRPPLSARRHWHGFHNAWATYISSALNARLPAGYFAEPNVQFAIEIHVAAFEEPSGAVNVARGADISAGVEYWSPPAPTLTIPLPIVTDIIEVLIFHSAAGPTLAGAIELISPANKDRPAHREAFVSKCETYLQQGIGLVVVDVVTDRHGNLHRELMSRLEGTNDALGTNEDLYAAAYRPVQRDGEAKLDVWNETLAIGASLPTLPLWLRGGIWFPVELAASHERTCREQRILP